MNEGIVIGFVILILIFLAEGGLAIYLMYRQRSQLSKQKNPAKPKSCTTMKMSERAPKGWTCTPIKDTCNMKCCE